MGGSSNGASAIAYRYAKLQSCFLNMGVGVWNGFLVSFLD
jgi:hypothetical protein